MSFETRLLALSWAEIEAAGKVEGWQLSRLDGAHEPAQVFSVGAEQSIAEQALVVLRWPVDADEKTTKVEHAIEAAENVMLDRQREVGKLARFSLS